jgi:hypothetical protein
MIWKTGYANSRSRKWSLSTFQRGGAISFSNFLISLTDLTLESTAWCKLKKRVRCSSAVEIELGCYFVISLFSLSIGEPDAPQIQQKDKMSTLLANSLIQGSTDNNNTVTLVCCSKNGNPPPKLEFFFGKALPIWHIFASKIFHSEQNNPT